MKGYRLKIAAQDFEELRALVFAESPRESGAFTLAGMSEHSGGRDIIVRRVVPIPKPQFALQHECQLTVSSRAINGLISLCQSNGLGAVLVHSHSRDIPYSASDDYGEKRICDALWQFLPAKAPTASLLFLPQGVRGRVWVPGATRPVGLSEILIVGRHLRRIHLGPSGEQAVSPIYDRQVRAFGAEGQTLIAHAKIGIIGVGGTGSPTAEQLARMGVKDLVLVDPDSFDPSNVTRMYGSFAWSGRGRWWPFLRKPRTKVEILASHLLRISPDIELRTVAKSVVADEVAAVLLDRDLLFLCTDDHWGRSVVNEFVYRYFIPAINLGMHIGAAGSRIVGASACVDILRPDTPCLWCRQFLRADRIRAESMPASERQSLKREGYVPDLDTPAPSVVSVTTALSGMAVTMFLQAITDFMGPSGNVHRLNYDVLTGEVRRGQCNFTEGCICKKVRGFGDLSTRGGVATAS